MSFEGKKNFYSVDGDQCVESASVQRRQSEQINSKGCLFVKFRETILVNAKLIFTDYSVLTTF